MPRRAHGREVSESATLTTRIMMPTDANILGNVFGGAILKYVDEVAAIAALRHARENVVTASIDRMSFITPVYVGNMLILKAAVNYVGKTSMEIGVRIEAEDVKTGEIRHTGSCYLTYVALGATGKPTPVVPIIPVTPDEKRRYKEAITRRKIREVERAAISRLRV